jgi:hypothetical protein
MTRSEVTLAWHRVQFELRWLRLSGLEFQRFFEDIMAKVESDFVPITPSGTEGDRKSDGYVPSKKHHYQVFAPPTGIDAAKACAKIKEDFDGALAHWPDMRAWTFVWSTPRGGLPPQVVELLDALDAEHPDVEVDQWGMEALWQRVRDLPEADRIDLLGAAPSLDEVTRIDSADVLSMLNTLAAQPIPATDELDFSLLAVGEKMERNGLGDAVRLLLTAAYALLPTVEKYLDKHPDTTFPDRVAEALKDLYRRLAGDLEDTPDALFGAMVEAIATPDNPASPRYWAAVAIVGYSFELCDVFKR